MAEVEESFLVLQIGSGVWVPGDPLLDPVWRQEDCTVKGGDRIFPFLPVLFPEYGGDDVMTGPRLQEGSTNRTNLRIHFVHCHMQDMLVILDQGNRSQPWCPCCNMFVPWADLNRRHPNTSLWA